MALVTASALDQVALSLGKSGYLFPTALVGAAAYVTISTTVREQGVAKGNTYWNVYSTVLGTLIGKFYWGEDISSSNLAGIGFCVVGLYLLSE